MAKYCFELPYPPTVNHYWKHAAGRHYISAKGRDYRNHVCLLARTLPKNISSRIAITIDAYMPDRRKRDLDNLPKAVFDSLVHAGVIVDDSQIDDMRITRSGLGGYIKLTITELG